MAVYYKNGSQCVPYLNNSFPCPFCCDESGNIVYTQSQSNTVKIMTYNVGQWYTGTGVRVPTAQKAEYLALQKNIFDTNNPDIILMQEYLNSWCEDDSPVSDLLADFSTVKYVTNPQGYIGHAMYSKNIGLSNYVSHTLNGNSGNYPTFETALTAINGKIVNIINTHNNYRPQYQQPEITQILSVVSDMEYFILCGDFNVNLSTESTTDEQYTINIKPFIDAGYNVCNCSEEWIPTYFGTSSATGGKFTDNIITSSNIEIVDLYADTSKLTDGITDKIDHLPLIATLRVN